MPEYSTKDSAATAVECVFRALARSELHRRYALKGGLALQWLYGSPRRSDDLDFNAAAPTANVVTEETGRTLLTFCRELDDSLTSIVPYHGVDHVETADVQLSAEIPALLGQVVYRSVAGSSGAVPMQVTLSEIICASEVRHVGPIPVRVASLEDIIAEKLKAVLQQAARDTIRSVDIYDVWYFTSFVEKKVRPEDVTPILIEKRKQWPTMPAVSRGEFRSPTIVEHAEAGYADVRDDLEPGAPFVPFEDAYGAVIQFVERLNLPA